MPSEPVSRRPPRKTMGTDLAPLYLFVILIGGGIAAAGWLFGRKQEIKETEARAAAEAQEVDPFAHIPDEVPPGLQRSAGDWPVSRKTAPTGIEAEPSWTEAQELADKAWTYAAEAKQAEAEDKGRTASEKTEAARVAFERALLITSEWELTLLDKHGERDPVVRRIVRTRKEWTETLELLSETSGR